MATIPNPELPSHIRDVVSLKGAAPDMRGKDFGPWARTFAKDPQSGGFGSGDEDERMRSDKIGERFARTVKYSRTKVDQGLTALRDVLMEHPGERVGIERAVTLSRHSGFTRAIVEEARKRTGVPDPFYRSDSGLDLAKELINGQFTEEELRKRNLQNIFTPEALTVIQEDLFSLLFYRLGPPQREWDRLSSVPGFLHDAGSGRLLEREDQIPVEYTNWLNEWRNNPYFISWRGPDKKDYQRFAYRYMDEERYQSWLKHFPADAEHNIFVGGNTTEVRVGALEARAIEPESRSAEKKVDGRIILAETPEEIELEAAIRTDSPDLIERRASLENLLERVPILQQSYPGSWENVVFTELQSQSTHYVSDLEHALQSLLGRLMYTPRQINQILDRFGFSAERRQELKDTIYENKRKYTINSDFHQDWKSDWRVERRIWVSDEDYQAWVSAREEAERRRMPAAIEGAFENDTLSTNPESLIRFFDGIAQSTEVIGQLNGSERTALGNRILEEVYTSLNGDLARARRLAGLVFSLGLESSFDDETREILADTSGLVIEGTIPQPIPSEESALQTIRGAFSNGRLDIENPNRVIQFFDGIAQATEPIRTLPPEARTALGDQILSEVNTSLDGDIPRAKRLSNVVYMLGLEGNFDEETQEILEDTARL